MTDAPTSDRGLAGLPPPRRLAVGCFLVSLLAFYGLAQVKLWTAAGGGALPSAQDVLNRYHGDPKRSRLHLALDPERPATDPRRMYMWLGETEEAQAKGHAAVVGWVDAGAPRERWPEVAPLFTGAATCGKCHARGSDRDGNPYPRADLPFETYEDVLSVTKPGEGMSLHELATTSHNHLFGFSVAALLVSWIFASTRWRGALVGLLIAGAFVGALLDIGCWWGTRAFGAPFHLGVLLGGGLFGAALVAMVVLSLDEAWLGGALGALVARPLRALRLARRE